MKNSQFLKINSPTPMWAKWMFRITAIVTTAISFYVAGSTLVLPQYKTEILLLLKSIDMVMLGFANMFGTTTNENPK